MLRDANMMQRLLWKDAMTIKPMVIAIVIGIVMLNLVCLLFSAAVDELRTSFGGFIALWILMPNLVALGAPALLVGSEEESGTLSWLRTLPVRWQQVVDSKFIVSLAAVAITWVVASLLLLVAHTAVVDQRVPVGNDFFSWPGVFQLAFFSIMLLTCGFITAYLVRSPVTALILLIPLVWIVNVFAMDIGRWILSGHWRYGGSIQYAGPLRWTVLIALALVALAALWLVQRYLACRRLTSPHAAPMNRFVSPATNDAYRPPARVGMSRPSPLGALLWQHSRQLGWPGVMLAVLVAVFVILQRFVDSSPYRSAGNMQILRAFAPGVITLGASWLGALTFFGDNFRRRCAYFADRGMSPTFIWWTRLLLPALLCGGLVLLQMAMAIGHGSHWERRESFLMAGTIVILFAFGQLVALWMPRASLTFFAAPAYTLISMFGLMFLYAFYPTYWPTVVLVVPVLFFASWRLMGRWLCGRIDAGFHGRVIAYTLLALLVPCLAVFGHRYGTTPAELTQWRARMMASEWTRADGVEPRGISPDAVAHVRTFVRDLDIAKIRDLMRQELASDGMIAEFVSQTELAGILDMAGSLQADGDTQIRHDAIEILLKWASIIREEAAAGFHELHHLDIAETAEFRAIEALESMPSRGDPRFAKLVGMIPSDELRRESRRIALTKAWRDYQKTPWEVNEVGGRVIYAKSFAMHPLAQGVEGLLIERRRADRFIDEATQLTLQQLGGRLPAANSPACLLRQQLWNEALGPQQYRPQIWIAGYYWTSNYQQRIDKLRARVTTDSRAVTEAGK